MQKRRLTIFEQSNSDAMIAEYKECAKRFIEIKLKYCFATESCIDKLKLFPEVVKVTQEYWQAYSSLSKLNLISPKRARDSLEILESKDYQQINNVAELIKCKQEKEYECRYYLRTMERIVIAYAQQARLCNVALDGFKKIKSGIYPNTVFTNCGHISSVMDKLKIENPKFLEKEASMQDAFAAQFKSNYFVGINVIFELYNAYIQTLISYHMSYRALLDTCNQLRYIDLEIINIVDNVLENTMMNIRHTQLVTTENNSPILKRSRGGIT